jgi:hypothetical protein
LSGWIKFWKDTDDDPRLAEAASYLRERYLVAQRSRGGGEDLSTSDELRFMRNALRGALTTLWCYADTHIGRDDTLPISSQTLDALVGIEGFCDVMPVDWIEKLDDGTVKLPGYVEKNELIAKEKRSADAKARQAAWRARSNSKSNASHNDSVTRDNSVTSRVSKCVRPRPTDLDRKKEDPTKVAERPRAVAEPPEFLKLKLAYPRRAGSQPWSRALQAINARLREGHSWDEILDGAHRYADFCSATGKVGTEHVQQAARFCGPGKEFLQPWGLPATKADTRLNANLSAADEFMRRTEPPDDTH